MTDTEDIPVTRRPNRTRWQDSPVSSPHYCYQLEDRRLAGSRSKYRVHAAERARRIRERRRTVVVW